MEAFHHGVCYRDAAGGGNCPCPMGEGGQDLPSYNPRGQPVICRTASLEDLMEVADIIIIHTPL